MCGNDVELYNEGRQSGVAIVNFAFLSACVVMLIYHRTPGFTMNKINVCINLVEKNKRE